MKTIFIYSPNKVLIYSFLVFSVALFLLQFEYIFLEKHVSPGDRMLKIFQIACYVMMYVLIKRQTKFYVSFLDNALEYKTLHFVKPKRVAFDDIKAIEIETSKRVTLKVGSEEVVVKLRGADKKGLQKVREAFVELKQKIENV
ncbi:MAG: hypothetical protein H6584_06465 [Flavobacteriales bacterium]|nr:hypothetical protein [Flavobacteriales bacterium]